MPPSKRPSWGTEASSTSPASWSAIPRPFASGMTSSSRGTTRIRDVSEKKGGPQTVDRGLAGPGGELPEGPPRPHRRRSDAGRGEVDEPVAPADRREARRVGDPGQSAGRLAAAPQAPVSPAKGVEEEDDGPARPESQRPVREHRPPQEEVPQR